MKTQEIIRYRITPPQDVSKTFVTESFEEAQSYHDEGCVVTEEHIMRWQPQPGTRTSTTVVVDWL